MAGAALRASDMSASPASIARVQKSSRVETGANRLHSIAKPRMAIRGARMGSASYWSKLSELYGFCPGAYNSFSRLIDVLSV
jgi:hypothetical protein